MRKEEEKFIKYMMMLPSKLNVEIYRAQEGGFWAKVKNIPGCVTQGENFLELVEMINDAVFLYFDVPEKFRKFLGYYVPEKIKQKLDERIKQGQIEEVVDKILHKQKSVLEFSR